MESKVLGTDAVVSAENLELEALVGIVRETTAALSPGAVATLIAHPDAVRTALAVTATALLAESTDRKIEVISGEAPRLVESREMNRRIATRTRMGKDENLLTSTQVARFVGLKTRQSVHQWLKKGRIVGWQGAKRGFVFPARQFDERRQPLDGLDRISRSFDDAYATWCWLTVPHDGLDGAEPLALLRQGKASLVEAAAKGHLQGDFA